MTAAPRSAAVALRVVLALARADYLQRVRRYAFLVTQLMNECLRAF